MFREGTLQAAAQPNCRFQYYNDSQREGRGAQGAVPFRFRRFGSEATISIPCSQETPVYLCQVMTDALPDDTPTAPAGPLA